MFQYFHQMNEDDPRFTVCVDVPEKDILLNFTQLNFPKDIRIAYGLVMVNDKDFYCRKTGRDYSSNRMHSNKFTLVSIDFIENYALMYLYNPELTITIRVHKEGNKPHFIHADLNKEV